MTEGGENFHGARATGDGAVFSVWAPRHDALELHIFAPEEQLVPMEKTAAGFHVAEVPGIGPGTRYMFRLPDGTERPDPASRHQPDGVHAASELVSDEFPWSDDGWRGLPLRDYVIYELHIGTFTEEGTFDAAIGELDRLKDLGITAIEIMPVAQFPGERNWGYDGVYPHSVQSSYGGPDGLRRLIDAAHSRGLAVVLDVVYNHLGPEGNYLAEFGPYFTNRYVTAWGLAMNFDGPGSDHVRGYFIQSGLQWVEDFHVDGLRLDAVHAIVDSTATPFLEEYAAVIHARARDLGREVALIAESDLNDPRVVRPRAQGGFDYDAQWADDFHHALHALVTRESTGYYADYGSVTDLARILEKGWLYEGQYSSYRGRKFGAPAQGIPAEKFVVCVQNHDQVGNRLLGDRLIASRSFEEMKAALGLVITSPFTPMLFMGEEYGEEAPFLYFVHHSDEELVKAVRNGRREEFAAFAWQGEIPDPDAAETFAASRLQPRLRETEKGRALQSYVRAALRVRREHPALRKRDLALVEAVPFEGSRSLAVFRRGGAADVLILVNFGDAAAKLRDRRFQGTWRRLLSSDDRRWLGTAAAPEQLECSSPFELTVPPNTLSLYERERES